MRQPAAAALLLPVLVLAVVVLLPAAVAVVVAELVVVVVVLILVVVVLILLVPTVKLLSTQTHGLLPLLGVSDCCCWWLSWRRPCVLVTCSGRSLLQHDVTDDVCPVPELVTTTGHKLTDDVTAAAAAA